jgi:hypothetical protein
VAGSVVKFGREPYGPPALLVCLFELRLAPPQAPRMDANQNLRYFTGAQRFAPVMTRPIFAISLIAGLIMLLPCSSGSGTASYEHTYPARIAGATKSAAKSFYVEFRGRNEAGGFGHSYVVLGAIDSAGESRQTVVAGFMPKDADDDRWGQFGVPVTGLVGVVRSDFVRRPDVRFRVPVSKARYYRVVTKVHRLRGTWTTYQLLVQNCNSFVGEIAIAAGLRTPVLTAQFPVWYIEELQALNSSNR